MEKNKDNEIILKYKINEGEKFIKILGFNFVRENKKNIYILYEGKKFELTHLFDISKYDINNLELKLKLIQKKELNDISYFFEGCSSLISISNLSNLNMAIYLICSVAVRHFHHRHSGKQPCPRLSAMQQSIEQLCNKF